MVAYATIDDVKAAFETKDLGARRVARMTSLLGSVTDELIGECGGRDYFRHPAIGSTTWYVDGHGDRVLHLHDGLVSLDSLRISFDLGLSYLALVAGSDYVLTGSDPDGEQLERDDEPYFHVLLRPTATYTLFPSGPRSVELTGARGWASVPTALKEGCVARVRQLAFADPSAEGTVAGPDEYGRPVVTTGRYPDVTYRFLQRERQRFVACRLAGN